MKKVFSVLLVVVASFLVHMNVQAEMIPVTSIKEEFPKTETIKSLHLFGTTYIVKIDSVNRVLNFVDDDTIFLSFDYTDEYLEYDNRGSTVTEDNYMDDIPVAFCFVGLMEALFTLSGYDDRTFAEMPTNLSYEEYGFVTETEPYEYSGTYDDGSSWSASGEYIKYLKISLDSEKLAKLAEDYAIDLVEDVEDLFTTDVIPAVSADEITDNSVTVYAKVDGASLDTELSCGIYRSTNIEGPYELVSDFRVACSGAVGLKDSGLMPNTTYYYTSMAYGGSEYGNIIEVRTLGSSLDSNSTNTNSGAVGTLPDNPKTAIDSHYALIIVSCIGSILLFFVIKKNRLFRKI